MLTLGLGWTERHDKWLFGILELIGVLPGICLFLLIDHGPAAEAAQTLRPTAPAPNKNAAWTYQLDCDDSMQSLLTKLNKIGPWTWTLRSNTRYGRYLSCRPDAGVRARIHRNPSQCTALLQIDHDSRATRARIDGTFADLMQKAGIEISNELEKVG
jgi:hypothetical protein